MPFEYSVVSMTADALATEREVYGGLAASARALADASVRTTVPAAEVDAIRAELDVLVARLAASQIPGAFGVEVTDDGTVRGHGNAVVGLRNPVAPPLVIERLSDRVRSSFTLGAVYEGPPGMVHGGVAALVLDQALGEAAAHAGVPGMTGTLRLRYEQATPLGECSIEAWVDRVDGVKTFVLGVLRRADGEVTVRAEGVFILPRWARDGGSVPRFE